MLRIISVVVSGSLFVSMASIAHQSHRRFRLTPINALAKAASNPAADVNVALNKPVTLNGLYLPYVSTVAPCLGTATPPQAHASTLVDGTFLTESKCYQLGSVYWNSLNPGNSVDINLGSAFLISSAIVQADDNDTYTLQYRDTAGVYHDWWHIPTAGTVGSTTRPNSNQTQRQNLASVLATGLRFFAPPSSGDGEYAVSEIQAFGVPVNVVDIGANVANPLFAGTSGSCPTSWVCTGNPAPGFAPYAPTAAQYPAGSPFPTSAFSPTVLGGSGTIRQNTPLTWVAGSTYVLNLWAGLPNTEPNGTTSVENFAPTARLYLTTAAGAQVAAFDIPRPPRGAFAANPISFTLPTNSPFIGQTIGVLIFVSAPSLFSANFDIAPVFTEVDGLVESPTLSNFSRSSTAFSGKVTIGGWVNFPGANGDIAMDILKKGNGQSDSDAFWEPIAPPFKPDTQPRTPIVDGKKQYSWGTDAQITDDRWPQGGTARFRFRAIANPNSGFSTTPKQFLSVVDDQGFQGLIPELILADSAITPATAPPTLQAQPKFLTAKPTLDPATTLKYYQHVGINADGTGPSIANKLSTLKDFTDRYFSPIPSSCDLSQPEVTATYYNRGDLGIGREMHCMSNSCSKETACYVRNYGAPDGTGLFGDMAKTLQAITATAPFATVAMVERGQMPFAAPNKVFFVVYGPDKSLAYQAKLDNKGINQSIPTNCMVCHGSASSYSDPTVAGPGPNPPPAPGSGPEVTNAYFLPFDLQSFDYYPSIAGNDTSRVAQESAFRRLNLIVYFTDLFFNLDAKNLLDGWYPPMGLGTKFQDGFVPQGWAADPNDKQLYTQVVAPTCRSCHISHSTQTVVTTDHLRFATFDEFALLKAAIVGSACASHSGPFSMPNAEQTSNIFWRGPERSQLLNRLNITSSGCGLNPPAPSSGALSVSELQGPASGVLQEYKTESCACTTNECLKQVENKYVGQIPAREFDDPSAGLIISEVVKCHQQILPTSSSPSKSVEELLLERDLARAKMFAH